MERLRGLGEGQGGEGGNVVVLVRLRALCASMASLEGDEALRFSSLLEGSREQQAHLQHPANPVAENGRID